MSTFSTTSLSDPSRPSHISTSFHVKKMQRCCSCIGSALGLILLIGSLIATGLLFPHIGYTSLAIGGVGFVFCLATCLSSYFCCKNPSKQPTFQPSSYSPEFIPPQNVYSQSLLPPPPTSFTSNSSLATTPKPLIPSVGSVSTSSIESIPSSTDKEPFSLEKFQKDAPYRQSLLASTQFWQEQPKAQYDILFASISEEDLPLIPFDDLEDSVHSHFYDTLKKFPVKADQFWPKHCSARILEVMDEQEITSYYAKTILKSHSPDSWLQTQGINLWELKQELQSKIYISLLKSFNLFPHPLHKDIISYVFALIHQTKFIVLESKRELALSILCSSLIKSAVDFTAFFKIYLCHVYENDTRPMREFPLCYLKTVLQLPNPEDIPLILAMFPSNPSNLVLLQNNLNSLYEENLKRLHTIFESQSNENRFRAELALLRTLPFIQKLIQETPWRPNAFKYEYDYRLECLQSIEFWEKNQSICSEIVGQLYWGDIVNIPEGVPEVFLLAIQKKEATTSNKGLQKLFLQKHGLPQNSSS